MTDEDHGDFDARERARQRRAAREPRTRAMREAYDAVKAEGPKSADAIRLALIREMAERGVTDPKPEELDVLTEAVTSPRRAGLKLIFRQVKMIGSVISLFRDLSSYSQPKWASTPENVPSVPDDEPRGLGVALDLSPEQLMGGRTTVLRALTDIRDQSEDGDDEEIRPVDTWVSLKSDNSIGVRIGNNQIAELAGDHTRPIRAAIQRWGGGVNKLRADANLLGSTPDSAHLDVWLPTPPTDGA